MSSVRGSVANDEAIEALVADILSRPSRHAELVNLLHEGHAVYEGRSTAAAGRIRGWVMAAFESVGLPPDAQPAVLEILRTSLDAYAVAAAAKAARGAVAPEPALVEGLVAALYRLRGRDDSVSFAALHPVWPAPDATTALLEVLRTLRHLGAAAHAAHADLLELRRRHADTWSVDVQESLDDAIAAVARVPLALHATSLPVAPAVPAGSGEVDSIRLEDQKGAQVTFGEHFRGRHHVVAFFYTRCENPAKCSATITRLGALQNHLDHASLASAVGIAAITYDPAYDTPARLAAYGAARGLRFTENVRLFRASSDQAVLRGHFDLKVGYSGATVNHHAIELYLIGPDAHTIRTWSRVEWTSEEVLDAIRQELQRA